MEDLKGGDRRIDRMRGCARLGMWLLVAFALAVVLFFGFTTFVSHRLWRHQPWPVGYTKQTMRDLQTGVRYFRLEYQRVPATRVDAAGAPVQDHEDQALRSEGIFLLSLLGASKADNPRDIKFVDLPLAKKGKPGLVDPSGDLSDPQHLALLDAWGEKYYLILDVNKDGQVANPERNEDATGHFTTPPPAILSTPLAIYSAGPDRDPKSWEDNICSWR